MRNSRWLALILIGLLAAVTAGCRGTAEENDKAVTVPVPVLPPVGDAPQDRVVVVERTVVVTATPVPTPAYVSRITVPAGTLVFPLSNAPLTLDPQEANDEASTIVVQQLYEGLFHLRVDGTVVPAAATGYQMAEDGKTYTVTLRAGMTWSDGYAVTAQQYVDGICRLLEPAVGNGYAHLLTDLVPVSGAKDFASGDVADCGTVGVKALDDLTLQITLEEPAAYLPQLFGLPVFMPARLDLAGSSESPGEGLLAASLDGSITNGAYVRETRSPGDRFVLAKNPRYWNAAAVAFDRVELPIVPDLAEQLARYNAGELHVAEFPATETPRILEDPLFSEELRVLARPGTSYLGLNTGSGATVDANVRRAIALAIDRQGLIDGVLQQPWHVPARGVVPPGIVGYQGDDPSLGIGYDPEAARQVLADAGYGAAKPVPPVELWYNYEGNNEAIFKAVGAMLERAGIPVRLVSSSWNVYRDALDNCNAPNRALAAKSPDQCSYNLYRMGWVMDYADPSSILDVVFSPGSAFQYTGWQSEEYRQLMVDAVAEPDDAKRTALYQQAERILLNDAIAVVPLQYYDRTILVKPALEFEFPMFGAPQFQYWRPAD